MSMFYIMFVTIRHRSGRPSAAIRRVSAQPPIHVIAIAPSRTERVIQCGEGTTPSPIHPHQSSTVRGIRSDTTDLKTTSPVPIPILTRPLLEHSPRSRALPTDPQQRERALSFSPGRSRDIPDRVLPAVTVLTQIGRSRSSCRTASGCSRS